MSFVILEMKLRVHCAEALGTPIVGDYKYGWKAHKQWEPVQRSQPRSKPEKLPFGLKSEGGSICDERPRLHLHCRQMSLPNIASALQQLETSSPSSTTLDLSGLDVLEFTAPEPLHMRESWEISNCWSCLLTFSSSVGHGFCTNGRPLSGFIWALELVYLTCI